jgi:hypothetical protein
MDHTQILQWMRDAGIVGILAFILIGGHRRWWVWGYQADELRTALAEMRKERDEWKSYAMRGADQSVRLATRSVELLTTPQQSGQ